jgi:hypothetical protein
LVQESAEVLIVQTADEHRLCLSMLRVAYSFSPEQVETILGGDPGWVVAWESGELAAVSLERWQSWVRFLAISYAAKLHAEADPADLMRVAETLFTLAVSRGRGAV